MLAIACVFAHSQSPAANQQPDRPRFDVASVKADVSNDGRVSIQRTGGRYTAHGVSLRLLLLSAYDVQEYQVIGAPPWAATDRFDIVATMPDTPDTSPVTPDGPTRQTLMLQSLLEERFRLNAHIDTRDMPIYGLVLARGDRTLGPSLHRSTVDCAALIAATRARGGPPPAPPAAGELPLCSSTVGPGFIAGRSRTMAQIATNLSRLTNTGASLGRPIVDRTALEGYYDFEIRFTPDRIPNFGPGGPPPGLPDIDPNGASIFAAMREQLGLKLEAQRGAVRVLVIDRVEKPAPD